MAFVVFLISALVVAVVGTKLSIIADRLADRTGFGEALIGAVALGATTSISGSVLSVYSAYHGQTDLAVSNALGGIAAQTFFLVLADIFYSKSNLEHAAASPTNLMFSVLLIILLCLPIVGQALPATVYWGVHPMTPILVLFYLGGLRYTQVQKQHPMWQAKLTKETVVDTPDEPEGGKELKVLLMKFAAFTVLLVLSGVAIKQSGVALAQQWGISHRVLGTLFTAVITSLPELITTFAAVRRGALALAVGGIVGGNTFDVLFLAFSDMAYSKGSIYHLLQPQQLSYLAMLILMVAVLAMGLLRREKRGLANIGLESFLIGGLYFASLYFVVT